MYWKFFKETRKIETRNACITFVGKPLYAFSLGRQRKDWED
jgi:hypothetical protein